MMAQDRKGWDRTGLISIESPFELGRFRQTKWKTFAPPPAPSPPTAPLAPTP